MEEPPEHNNALIVAVTTGIAVLTGVAAYLVYRKVMVPKPTPLIAETLNTVDAELVREGITVTQPLKDMFAMRAEASSKEFEELEAQAGVKAPSSSPALGETPIKSQQVTTTGAAAAGPMVHLPDTAGKIVGIYKFPMVDVRQTIAGLKACAVCHQKATGGTPLKKCGQCKVTFYCSEEHQKEAWTTHKLKCPAVASAVQPGHFEEIRKLMARFNPTDLASIDPQYATEAWAVLSSALKEQRYESELQLATLLLWAGTASAVLSGIALRSKPVQGAFNYQSVYDIFSASMNFYFTGLEVCLASDDPMMLTVRPYCQFELFGLYTMLATTLEKEDPQRMSDMLQQTSIEYGVAAIQGLIQLLSKPEQYNLDLETAYGYLQGWTLANMNVLTRDLQTLVLAERVSSWLNSLFDMKQSAEAMTCSAMAQAYYAAAVMAADSVAREAQLMPPQWQQSHIEAFHQRREQIAEDLLAKTVPGFSQHQQQQRMAQGIPPSPNDPPQVSPQEVQANYVELRSQMAQVIAQNQAALKQQAAAQQAAAQK